MPELNETIHQPVRLRIMAALVALEPSAEVEFTYLRHLLDVTDGNLGAHLRRLEEAGYITANKTFVERKPRTFLSATPVGRRVFREHVAALWVDGGDLQIDRVVGRLEAVEPEGEAQLPFGLAAPHEDAVDLVSDVEVGGADEPQSSGQGSNHDGDDA